VVVVVSKVTELGQVMVEQVVVEELEEEQKVQQV
jgi:hypothetical protein